MKRVLLILLMLLGAGAAQAESPVTLRPAVDVNRSTIRLSDVFDGVPGDIDRDIATAPAPGKSVTYEFRVLAQLAEQYRLDWHPQSLADRAVLTRAATKITPEMIQDAIKRKVRAADSRKATDIEIQFDGRNTTVYLPAESEPVFDLANFDYDAQGKRFRAEVVASVKGQTDIRQPFSGRVIVKRDVPVLGKRLSAGTTVGAGDLAWITVNDDRIGEDVLLSADAIVGQELRHDQGEGELVRSRDLMPPRLVTRGSIVTVKVETPLMLITVQGRALQDGGKGDTVRVTNTQSNKVIEGTVDGAGVVRLGVARQMAFAD